MNTEKKYDLLPKNTSCEGLMVENWQSEDVECEISDKHFDCEYRGQTCVITNVQHALRKCRVYVKSTSKETWIKFENLKPVRQQNNQMVRYFYFTTRAR